MCRAGGAEKRWRASLNVLEPGTVGLTYSRPYNASKAAVKHLASSLAVEWATNNIRVNCISPGYMRTAL